MAQSVEVVISEDDLKVMQEEALKCSITDWLQDLRAEGKTLRPENSRRLRKAFIDEKLDEIFDILPQPLREDDEKLDTRVSYLINDLLETEAEENTGVDTGLPLHQQIWEAMLAKARVHKSLSKEYRYQPLIDNQGSAKLFSLMEKCADDFIWKDCVVGGKALDPEFLHSMKEDFRHKRPDWYLIFMWDEKCQVWEWYRVYVGQAGGGEATKTLLDRANQHRTNSSNLRKKELLYRVWRAFEEETADENLMNKVKIVKLAFAPGQDEFSDPGDADLFLNLGEMYFSLVFRSLQTQDLLKWLPAGTAADHSDLAPLGLNVALPLSQGRVLESTMAFGKLANSNDPKVREACRRTLRQNMQKVIDDHFVKNTATLRKNAAWADENIFRDGPVGQTVQVKCANCGWVKQDLTPRYIIRTGQYLSRTSGCAECPVKEGDKNAKRITSRRVFVPADDTIPSERSTLIYKRLGKPGWPEYYRGVRARAPANRRGE
ncbi:hypothetical protein LA080_006015 [Diaporthe eres]|uniref:Uncharacterized protein n=1 Tax=Diaporthe vaccinii TaxID=105482 RepID=A0ABR4EYZ9_9PEZI|nr:hypothetical protein LA080_006015 [Diaporthe eres]